jgi:hypothetical protein
MAITAINAITRPGDIGRQVRVVVDVHGVVTALGQGTQGFAPVFELATRRPAARTCSGTDSGGPAPANT